MLFNSPEYFGFLLLIFLAYWAIRSIRERNMLLLLASYFFYGCWDWRFLGLIILSSCIDYTVGNALGRSESRSQRKFLLSISLSANLGLLFVFKYFNFFADSLAQLLNALGYQPGWTTLNLILPVGISFYTFQTLSYTIDVYRNKIAASTSPLRFFTFVAFFPQLVAGPIERAKSLLPQFSTKKAFSAAEATQGLRQILWGLIKKVVIADQCGPVVDYVFANYDTLPSSYLLLGAVLFSFQIYGDFSGYSDIAIGTARLFGFRLMRNFAYPYFSRNVGEFWRRWHISLSTWFRDYLYIPLGGSRVDSPYLLLRNVLIVFLVSGFWHGANWTFLAWGALHALYFIPLVLTNRNRRHLNVAAKQGLLPNPRELLAIVATFSLVSLAWILFRAENIAQAYDYLLRMFTLVGGTSAFGTSRKIELLLLFGYLAGFLLLEWRNRRAEYPFAGSGSNKEMRWTYYLVCGLLVVTYLSKNEAEFIYFQF